MQGANEKKWKMKRYNVFSFQCPFDSWWVHVLCHRRKMSFYRTRVMCTIYFYIILSEFQIAFSIYILRMALAWYGMAWRSMVCHDKNVQHRQLRAPNIHSAAVFVWTISLYPLELARYTHIPLFKNTYKMGERANERPNEKNYIERDVEGSALIEHYSPKKNNTLYK